MHGQISDADVLVSEFSEKVFSKKEQALTLIITGMNLLGCKFM